MSVVGILDKYNGTRLLSALDMSQIDTIASVNKSTVFIQNADRQQCSSCDEINRS